MPENLFKHILSPALCSGMLGSFHVIHLQSQRASYICHLSTNQWTGPIFLPFSVVCWNPQQFTNACVVASSER
ncbi:9306_t:CDS:1, partial [Paraglomus occultum]